MKSGATLLLTSLHCCVPQGFNSTEILLELLLIVLVLDAQIQVNLEV